jgi:hypothetical protein
MRYVRVLAVLSLVLAGLVPSPEARADWEPLRRLTNTGGTSGAPDVAASGSTAHVVWMEMVPGYSWQVRYKRSENRGQTWGAPQNLTRRAWESRYPAIAVDGDTVHVVFTTERPFEGSQVYYRRSDDGGDTWGDAKRLSFVPFDSDWCDSTNPAIDVAGDLVHVVWNDMCGVETHHRRSTDGGTTWSARRVIADGQIPDVATSPTLSAIVWERFRDIHVAPGPDGGRWWRPGTVLDDTIADHSAIHVAGSRIDVVWSSQRYGNPEVAWRYSEDGGDSWSPQIRMSTDPRQSWGPQYILGGSATAGMRFIAWNTTYDDGTSDVMVKHHRIGMLLPWFTDRVSGGRPSRAGHPEVAVAGRWLYVVFSDDVSGSGEIYVRAYSF